jgi:hypothetical protein
MKIRGQVVHKLEDRLSRMVIVNPTTDCHEWQGAKFNGYGRLTVGSRVDGSRHQTTAHRASYVLHHGEVPEGHEICHKCDNPSCINPAHLFAGTRQDNVEDREAKGRGNQNKGSKVRTSKLVEADIVQIKILRSNGESMRSIARIFKVHHKVIMEIIKGTAWKHV